MVCVNQVCVVCLYVNSRVIKEMYALVFVCWYLSI